MRWLSKRSAGARAVGENPDASSVLTDAIALLEAGLPPARAWDLAGVEVDGEGMPLPAARVWAGEPMVAAAVIAACALARETGMPLARVLARVDSVLAREQDARDAAEAELAGPRMSAKVLRWLPLVGVVLTVAVDPSALEMLFTSPLGWALLGAAGLLTWAGSAWMARLVERAGEPPHDGLPVVVVLALVDAALAAGLDVSSALARTADAVAGDHRTVLRSMAAALAYDGQAPDVEGPLARALSRPIQLAQLAGAPASHGLRGAMLRLEREARREAAKSAGELGVRLAIPLAMCLLPAFALAGVVPLIIAVVVGADLGSLDLGDIDTGVSVPGP